MLRTLFKHPIHTLSRNLKTLSNGTRLVDMKNNETDMELVVQDADKTKTTLKFNPYWLRFNCHSSDSKHKFTGQRQINGEEVPFGLKIAGMSLKENDVIINWNAESKQGDSVLPLDFLINNCPTTLNPSPRFNPCKELTFFDYKSFYGPDGSKNDDQMLKFLTHMSEYGMAIVRNCGVKQNTVQAFAELTAPIQKTIYGEQFDVKVDKNPINIAYAEGFLPFHMDLVYYEAPPGLQFLHCLEFDDVIEGGESTLLDGFLVAEDFRREHPEYFEHLSKIPVTFQKLHIRNSNPEVMIHHRPHIKLNNKNEIMAMTWSPANEGILKNVSEQEQKDYFESYLHFSRFLNNHPNIIRYRLQPGEIMCFNNRRTLHGREAFNSNNGSRHFQGCYVNIDEFKSELRSLYVKKELPKSTDVNKKNFLDLRSITLKKVSVGNNDFE